MTTTKASSTRESFAGERVGPVQRRSGTVVRGAFALLLALFLHPLIDDSATASCQGPEGLSIGLTLGGVSFVGFAVEYVWGEHSIDLTVGTWAFRDLSVSVVGKQYLGPGPTRPFVGIGLWGVAAPSGQTGLALVLRAPIGVDWETYTHNHLGMAMNINRALAVRRSDPRDQRGPNDRLIPLPGFYYRWRR